MPLVKFIKEKKEIEVPIGANLRNEALKAGINLNQGLNGMGSEMNRIFNCKGLGLCGTCRVLIKDGVENTNKMTLREWLKFKTLVPTGLVPDPIPALAYIGHEDEMRLACCTTVHGDLTVESGPELNLFGENFFS
jgi:ferredoxin